MRRSALLAVFLALLVCLLVPSPAFAQENEAAGGNPLQQLFDLFATLMKYLLYVAIAAAVITVVMMASWWAILSKAGEPGWAILVPIYQFFPLARIVERPRWALLLFIPPITIIALFWWALAFPMALAEKFGKGPGFGLGLMFLSFIFVPILAFGEAEYVGASSGPRRRPTDDDDEEDRPRRRGR